MKFIAISKIILVALVALQCSCASMSAVSLTPETMSVVAAAEAFVVRHGLTAAGHPKNLPVERIELLEGLSTEEQIVKNRFNMVQPKAFAVDREDQDYFVLFHETDGDCTIAIVVTGGKAWKQMHACYEFPSKGVLVLPPNNSFKPKPLRGSA